MKRAIIFANGNMEVPPSILMDLDATDMIFAADGGTHHCKSLGITPHVIIGDFDSLESGELTSFKKNGVDIQQYPTHKDETDLELALQLVLKYEVREVFIIGALGARWDMTITNILLAAHPKFSHLTIRLLDGVNELAILRGERQYDFTGEIGDLISLIPVAGDALGITTHGLEYPLNNETLYFGSSRGVSNVFVNHQVQIFIKQGILLCCILNREVH